MVVSGIGCSSRLPGFVTTYGFHSLHGRPLPVAMGVKLANPDLTVIAVGGDGDGFAIGAGHFPHAARRNVDITYLVMDNEIYGLTKGQVSPTSLTEQKAPSTPWGNLETPLNTLAFAVASGASFVARGASFNTKALTELIVQAMEHKGFSYIDALSPCVVFNNHQEEWKELVTDVAPDHDVTSKTAAFDLALRGGFKLGILYREQRADARRSKYQALVDASKDSDVASRCSRASTPARARRSASRRPKRGATSAGRQSPTPARRRLPAGPRTRRHRLTAGNGRRKPPAIPGSPSKAARPAEGGAAGCRRARPGPGGASQRARKRPAVRTWPQFVARTASSRSRRRGAAVPGPPDPIRGRTPRQRRPRRGSAGTRPRAGRWGRRP